MGNVDVVHHPFDNIAIGYQELKIFIIYTYTQFGVSRKKISYNKILNPSFRQEMCHYQHDVIDSDNIGHLLLMIR